MTVFAHGVFDAGHNPTWRASYQSRTLCVLMEREEDRAEVRGQSASRNQLALASRSPGSRKRGGLRCCFCHSACFCFAVAALGTAQGSGLSTACGL